MEQPQVSVVIPTLNEGANLPELIQRLAATLRWRSFEIIIIDDDSRDQTQAICQDLAARYPLRLFIRREGNDGLSGAVIEGLNRAQGEYLVVMDADLQHPPEEVPALLSVLANNQADFVIGSRHVPGSSVDEHWSSARRLISQAATWLARPFAGDVHDPMSGFFALRKSTYAKAATLSPVGYKIGLELICKCPVKTIKEVPIHFATRQHGQSKLSLLEPLRYLRHLARLNEFKHPRIWRPAQFILTSALSVAAALSIRAAVEAIGIFDLPATMIACLVLITLASLAHDSREVEPAEVVEVVPAISQRQREAA